MPRETDLFDLLRSLYLAEGDYAVFGSGPLIVRGVIEATNDLDILSRGIAWATAAAAGELVELREHGVTVVSLFDGAITVGTEWAIGDFDVDELIDTAEMIDGIPFVRLEHVVAYKRLAGRPKDLEHLKLLAAHQARGR
jgi:predicted nucleotidyltransferase